MPPSLHHAPAYLVTANSQHVLRLSSAAHDEESGDLVPSFVYRNDVTSMRRSVTVIVAAGDHIVRRSLPLSRAADRAGLDAGPAIRHH